MSRSTQTRNDIFKNGFQFKQLNIFVTIHTKKSMDMDIAAELDVSLITLTLDMGASISKALYSFENLEEESQETEASKIHLMYMDAEMITISEKMVENLDFWNMGDVPENYAWIKSKPKDNKVTAFGLLAKKFKAMKQIHLVKYENALDKCLAFIGAIIKKHNLNPFQIEVNLNLLIPYDEFKSRDIIHQNLRQNIQNFYFQTLEIKSKLGEFNCYPEGFGGFINRAYSQKKNWLIEKKIAVLMIGHRNCSCLIFEQGNLFHGETISTGFFDLIKDIKNNSIGQKIEDLEFIIPKISSDLNQSKDILSSLIRGNKRKNQQSELKKIKSAVENSREKLWNIIFNWLDSQIPNYLHEIMILGGAAQYFQEELKECFDWSKIDWSLDLANEIDDLFFKNYDRDDKLSFRFIDVFGLHKYMMTID